MKRVLSAFLAFGIGAALPAVAQTTADGSLRGHVKDEQGGALAGVTLTATSPTVPGSFTATTDSAGYYRLLNLGPGEYQVAAELMGFSKHIRSGIVIRAGLNLGLELTLKVGALTETVEVKLDTPMVEAQNATQAINVDGDFQRALPISVRREAFGYLYLTPGAVSLYATTFKPPFYVHGSESGSHVIQMDGADIAPAGHSSNVLMSISSEALGDVQIKVAGVPASAPLGQGAVVNMVSQSGTNSFKGSALLVLQPKSWSSNNNPAGTATAFSLAQPEIAIGGPVVRDRSWFFASYRYHEIVQGVGRSADQLATLQALFPGFEPLDTLSTSHQSFVKSTTQLSPRHQLQAFHQYGIEFRDSVSPTWVESLFLGSEGGHSASARLLSNWGSAFNSRIGVAYSDQSNPSTLPRLDRPGRRVFRSAFVSGGRLTGNTEIAAYDNYPFGAVDRKIFADKLTFTAEATLFRSGWLGSHELQAGLYLQPLRKYQAHFRYVNGGFGLEELVLRDAARPAAGSIPFHRQIFDSSEFEDWTNVNSTDYAAYVQDAWRPIDRLTLNLGLRVDRVQRVDHNFDMTVQRTNAIGPRLGAVYRLDPDGRSVARASWGRLHNAVLSTATQSVGRVMPGLVDQYDMNLDGVFETEFVTPRINALTAGREIDLEGYRQPHVDEWLVGYQHQLPGRITVDGSFIHRTFFDRVAQLDVNSIFENGVFKGYRNEAFNVITRLTSNLWNQPVYRALQFQLAKETSRLQVLANYVRQWRRLRGTWQPNDPASFVQPEAFPNHRGIGLLSDVTTNGLSGNDMASNEQWRDHALRFAAAHQGPRGLRLSATYMLESGAWSGPVVTRMAAADTRFGPPTVTLSNGRVVPNPLATTIRFVGPTRGDGQFTTPWLGQASFRAGCQFQLGRMRVEPALDVLNAFNPGAFQSFGLGLGANQTYSSTYRVGTSRQPPRSWQVSLRVQF